MSKKKATIEVYGADVICASCVNAPSSKDTYEWLKAAIGRKYPSEQVEYRYIDIDGLLENDRDKTIAEKIQNDEFFYPLVLINNEVVGEGYIQLKPIHTKLTELGFSTTE